MKQLIRPVYRYGSQQLCPSDRMSSSKILQNVNAHKISHQLLNNLQIGLNCTKIAIKYVPLHLFSPSVIFADFGLSDVPYFLSADPLQSVYQMSKYDQLLSEVQKLFLQQCPLQGQFYQQVFRRFDFQNKGTYAAFSLLQTDNLNKQQQQLVVKFLAALQLVNLGFSLHHSIGKSQKLNFVTRLALKLMSKQMKDSYLVLGGDYFHIKGSVLAAETNNIKLSQLLSDVEIDLCKYVHLTEQLKNKILTQGYDKVNIQQIYNISVLKTSPIVKGLMAIDIITNKSPQQIESKKKAYELIGLLMLYRRDLQNFMFNFKDILKKYGQYKQNRINFDSEQSLPYFIFFEGAQDFKKIDTSYFNTVTMMSNEIKYLQGKLGKLLGEKAEQLQKKMNYFLMIYS